MLIFETLINLFQAVIYGIFLVKCLEKKNKYTDFQIYSGFIFSVFFYLQIQLFVTDFEGYGIILLVLFTILLSRVFCKDNIISIVVYNLLISVLAMFASIIGASWIGIITNHSFMQLTMDDSIIRAVAVILIQVLWVAFLIFILLIVKDRKKFNNKKYTYVALIMPLLSVVICTVIMTKMQMQGMSAVWNIVVVFGIFLLNIIDYMLLHMINKSFIKISEDELTIRNYEQQKANIERIKREHIIVEKNRHEMKRVLGFVSQMLQENENNKVIEYLNKMDIKDIIPANKRVFTENIVLNYILNRTYEKCDKKGIDLSCMVSGIVDKIAELDIHILMENLIDNAIEAIENSVNKSLYIAISSNEKFIDIEIANSVCGNVLENNPGFENTTKQDKFYHGYGVKNIKDIVNKYNGTIEYKYIDPDSVVSKVVLIKAD